MLVGSFLEKEIKRSPPFIPIPFRIRDGDAGVIFERVTEWVRLGARIVGGCCRVTPGNSVLFYSFFTDFKPLDLRGHLEDQAHLGDDRRRGRGMNPRTEGALPFARFFCVICILSWTDD
jgi:hypothetical protein